MSPRRNCKVTEIDFGSRSKEVNGALDERFGELRGLGKVLNHRVIQSFRRHRPLAQQYQVEIFGHVRHQSLWWHFYHVELGKRSNPWIYLQQVLLANQMATGKGVARSCKTSSLAGSNVSFRPPQLETGEKHSWMPKLTNLDLTKCPINSDVSELLKSFQHCTSLGSLQAVSSGLTGHLDGRATASSLVALDFALNKLTHVEAVPPRCKSLILSGNSNITFSPEAFQKAMKDGVFLDLQNVTFAKEESSHGEKT